MDSRFSLFLIFSLLIISCTQKENPNKLIDGAINVYLNTDLDENIKIDSSLFLTNKALKIDNQNLDALTHKSTLLFRRKDLKGLIQVTNELINLSPDYPIYIAQKALLREIQGKTKEAQHFYNLSIEGYQDLIKSDSANFDLLLEYYGALEVSGDTIGANALLNNIKQMELEEYQFEILNHYKDHYISKSEVIKYWNGEINYEQLGGKQ